ncbi:MAG: tripartite tricarboxylate transporter TctB family protein [Casimicrobiaceae bacterium]
MATKNKIPAGAASTRWMELVVAFALVVIGAIVIVDSHRVGIEWGDDGPKSGYFPNFIGWILAAAACWIAVETLVGWKKLAGKVFVTREELKPVLAMFVPTVIYVALIAVLGIYVASAIYIAAFMVWQGKYKWLPTVSVSVGVPVAIFLMFEMWFLVPLPKGPLERLLGY